MNQGPDALGRSALRDRVIPRGQILPLFALSLLAMLAMAALLFDGAHALVLRRQYQSAADASALAAANAIQSGSPRGCSATAGPPAGAPRPAVITAAKTSVAANLPSFDLSKVTVTCPTGWWGNYGVKVDLGTTTPTFFGGVIGISGLTVSTSGTAVNGQVSGTKYSVVELNQGPPYTNGWPGKYNGCSSVLFGGGNTVTLDGSMQVDSACTAAAGGALSENGTSANITFNNSATANIVGQYLPPVAFTPLPINGQKYVKDPLGGLIAPPWTAGSFPVQSKKTTTLSGGATVLEPGLYTGGIVMKNQAVAFMHPGLYVFAEDASGNGGFQTGGGNKVYSIPQSLSSTTDSAWTTDCTSANCGVLLYNTGMIGNDIKGSEKDQISVGAGATLKLRPYVSTADSTGVNDPTYQNLLIWQDVLSKPSATYAQPPIALSGGGSISISGTLYAPSAVVTMGGNSGGSGGSSVDITLQFISWDLQFNGNLGFHFFYQSDQFAKQTDYGLIQ
jgi:Flp pilus assembly protein TadG